MLWFCKIVPFLQKINERKALFYVLYHFTRMLDIKYICSIINQGECCEKSKLAYTDKITKEIANKLWEKELRENCNYSRIICKR